MTNTKGAKILRMRNNFSNCLENQHASIFSKSVSCSSSDVLLLSITIYDTTSQLPCMSSMVIRCCPHYQTFFRCTVDASLPLTKGTLSLQESRQNERPKRDNVFLFCNLIY